MEEYRIDMKVRNNLILTKIEQYGYKSPYDFCYRENFSYVYLLRFLNMKISIFDTKGRIRPIINRLCEKLNCIPEELFSASQMEASLKDNKKTVKVCEAEARFMLEQSNNQLLLEKHYDNEKRDSLIEKTLNALTPRHKKIIEMRLGLGDFDREHTLEEVAQAIGVTRETVRQMEAKAYRIMRHPSKADKLKEFLDE
jgi:RNA polymerase primary sigma factor